MTLDSKNVLVFPMISCVIETNSQLFWWLVAMFPTEGRSTITAQAPLHNVR